MIMVLHLYAQRHDDGNKRELFVIIEGEKVIVKRISYGSELLPEWVRKRKYVMIPLQVTVGEFDSWIEYLERSKNSIIQEIVNENLN